MNVDLDSIISESPRKYYYYLSSPETEVLYPICRDFSCRKFPHKSLPPAWKNELPNSDQPSVAWPSNWTAISDRIKARDTECLISGWKDSLTTSFAKTDKYTPQNCSLILLSQMMASCYLIVKPKNWKRT